MGKKTLDDIARLMAAGFRAQRIEAQAQRRAIQQLQEAVVQYSRSVEQRDEVKGERLGKLETDVRELQRKAAM
jgi:hypothetical protein